MPTIIAFHPSGYEIRFDVTLEEIPSMVAKLTKRHYRPSRAIVYTAEGLPLCPKHGVPMQKREKQGDTWYSHKVTDPLTGEQIYCRGYAGPSSPGYAIEPDSPAPSPAPAVVTAENDHATGSSTEQRQQPTKTHTAAKPNGRRRQSTPAPVHQPTKRMQSRTRQPDAAQQRANGNQGPSPSLTSMNLDELNEALFG